MYNLFVILFAKVLNFFANILCKILHKDNGNMLGKIVKKLSPDILKSIKIGSRNSASIRKENKLLLALWQKAFHITLSRTLFVSIVNSFVVSL